MKPCRKQAAWAAAANGLRLCTSTMSRSALLIPVFALVVLCLTVAEPSHAETISPRRLLELTDLGNPVISPDGRYVAFRTERASVERNTYDTGWYVQALDGKSPPLRVADGGVPLREYIAAGVRAAPAVWSPDGRWIYYRADIGGRVSVWRAATDGSGAGAVTSDPADVRDFALSNDGKTLKYSVGATREEVGDAEEAEYDQGIRIDDTVNISAGLFRSSKLEGRPTTQRFVGEWFEAGPLLANVPDRWKAVDLATMTNRQLPASGRPVPLLTAAGLSARLPEAATKVVSSPGDGRVAILLPGKKEKGVLAGSYVELAMLPDSRSSRPVRCMAELCRNKSITDIQWRPASDEILFTATDHHKGRAQGIFSWDVVTGTVRPVVLSDGLVRGSSQRYWDIPCALSRDTLVCVAAEADHPPRLEAIDVDSGHRQILFAPNEALDRDIASTVPAKLIRWKDEQGREFIGQFFEARGANAGHPAPMFVTFYNCYGFLRGGVGDEWPLATLAEVGISALCINQLPQLVADSTMRYDQARTAIESVVRLLSAEGRVDRTRIGMGGLSYGSEATLWTVAHSDVVKAASVSGISVTPTFYLFNSLQQASLSNLRDVWGLGAPDETPEQWKKVSPVYQLDSIKAPILFQLAEQEYRMTLDYSLPLVRAHKAEIYAFPDEPHIKFQPRHKLAVYERNVDWFRFWLQGYEDPDPGKAGQYRIWSEMKSVAARDEP
jgi:dipeptidyl aminopeptidase/acylaminoacyl peptidase